MEVVDYWEKVEKIGKNKWESVNYIQKKQNFMPSYNLSLSLLSFVSWLS